jgi:hypothetical protein
MTNTNTGLKTYHIIFTKEMVYVRSNINDFYGININEIENSIAVQAQTAYSAVKKAQEIRAIN